MIELLQLSFERLECWTCHVCPSRVAVARSSEKINRLATLFGYWFNVKTEVSNPINLSYKSILIINFPPIYIFVYAQLHVQTQMVIFVFAFRYCFPTFFSLSFWHLTVKRQILVKTHEWMLFMGKSAHQWNSNSIFKRAILVKFNGNTRIWDLDRGWFWISWGRNCKQFTLFGRT